MLNAKCSMFPSYIPSQADRLTESTSITIVKQIKQASIPTSFTSQPVLTTYVREGEGGTPILLLHGFDSSLIEYRRLLPLLAEKQETWAVDLFGFGFCARNLDIPINPETIKTHLYYFWKTLIQQPVILVGASMGGAAAIDFTLTYPEVVEKLVLIDSAGLIKPPAIGKFMFPPLDYLATEFLRNPKVRQNISRTAYYDKSFASVDAQNCTALHLYCENWHKALVEFTKSGGYGSFLQELPKIEQQTLILWGRQDKIVGTKGATKFKAGIPNSKLVWLENCGHVPHLEKPQITAEEIVNVYT